MRMHTTVDRLHCDQLMALDVNPAGWLASRISRTSGELVAQERQQRQQRQQQGRWRGSRRSEGQQRARLGALARTPMRLRASLADYRPPVGGRPAADRVGVTDPAIDPSCRRSTTRAGRAAQQVSWEGGYQLGRWARLALTITVVTAVGLAVAANSAGSAAGRVTDVTVVPGDTLWSIATTASPDRDPRDVIDEIHRLNDLPSETVRAGEVLRVPDSA